MSRDAVPRIRNPFRVFVNVFLWITFVFLVLPVPLLLLSVSAETAGIVCAISWSLALGMAIAAGISAIYAGVVRRRLRRLQDGDYLVCWTYSPAEWENFAQSEAAQTSRAAPEAMRLGFFIAGLTGLAGGIAVSSAIVSNWWVAVLCGLMGGIMLGAVGAAIGWGIRSLVRGRAGRTRRRVLRSVPLAYISQDGAYCAGVYWSWSWRVPATSLKQLRILPGEPNVLEFTITYQGQYGPMDYRHRVPVPTGRDPEAEWIIQTLTQ